MMVTIELLKNACVISVDPQTFAKFSHMGVKNQTGGIEKASFCVFRAIPNIQIIGKRVKITAIMAKKYEKVIPIHLLVLNFTIISPDYSEADSLLPILRYIRHMTMIMMEKITLNVIA